MKTQHHLLTRRRHRVITAIGIVGCATVAVLWPEESHLNTSVGTIINLFWLLFEPAN